MKQNNFLAKISANRQVTVVARGIVYGNEYANYGVVLPVGGKYTRKRLQVHLSFAYPYLRTFAIKTIKEGSEYWIQGNVITNENGELREIIVTKWTLIDSDINSCLVSEPKFQEEDTMSGVYFMGNPSLDHIKIGYSADIENRLRIGRIFDPYLKLYGAIEGGVEKELKSRFAHIRIRHDGKITECFTKTQELKDFILNLEYPKPSLLIHEILENRQELI